MNRIFTTAALAASLWALTRWLDSRTARTQRSPRAPTENWENESGALAPHPAGLETSQVPR